MKKILLLAIPLASVVYAGAQENPNINLPVVGMGLHVEQFRLGDILTNNVPSNSFIFTFNINNVFRIEPEYGFYSNTTNGTTGVPDITSSSNKLGLGLYYMFQKDNFNFSLGALVERRSASDDNLQYNFNGYAKYTDETTSTGYGPALSGEYFFGRHFSFGGNLALVFNSTEVKAGSTGDVRKSKTSQTQTGLLARFYF